ncbi:hypothetical protein R6Z07M_015438 [Ovis aries]
MFAHSRCLRSAVSLLLSPPDCLSARSSAGGRGETRQKAQMLGVLPGPRPAWARSSVGSRCPANFDFRCLALFARDALWYLQLCGPPVSLCAGQGLVMVVRVLEQVAGSFWETARHEPDSAPCILYSRAVQASAQSTRPIERETEASARSAPGILFHFSEATRPPPARAVLACDLPHAAFTYPPLQARVHVVSLLLTGPHLPALSCGPAS